MRQWLLYGCNGYSGQLIARYAVSQGLRPILAGRNEKQTRQLAEELGLEYRCFGLDDTEIIAKHIRDCFLVFNSAGPYTLTCQPLLDACLATGVHNLSLVGEIPILEQLQKRHLEAQRAGILLAVGLGYDVHPTDCLIQMAHEELPDATHLELLMDGPTDMSPGSYKELIQQIGEEPFWVRRNGKLVEGAPHSEKRVLDGRRRLVSSIAWGDTATAYHATGVPNIDVYTTISTLDLLLIKLLRAARGILRRPSVRTLAYWLVDRLVSGPDHDTRENGVVNLHVQLRNKAGRKARASVQIPTSYKITYLSAVYAIKHVLGLTPVPAGYHTPAQLLGAKSLFQIPGVRNFTLNNESA